MTRDKITEIIIASIRWGLEKFFDWLDEDLD